MRSVNFAGMRSINRSIVLNLIRAHGSMSRAEIAERSHLATSAVSNIVSELLQMGLIREGETVAAGSGRPATLLELNTKSVFAIGVNVGFTNIQGVATDLAGRLLERATIPTKPEEGPQSVLSRVAHVVREVSRKAGIPSEKVGGVGVGIPGLVDIASGRSVYSPNLTWRDVPVQEILEADLSLPIYVDNDVRAATLGESTYGSGQGARHLVALFVGSAIGAGLILDGRLYYGASHSAGEIGHIRVTEDGPQCSCGKYGCLEAVASGRAIARKAGRLIRMGAARGLLDRFFDSPDSVTAKDVAEAAAAGDSAAAQIMEEAARYVGLAISFLVNTYNPDRVVIGGGVSRSGELLLGPARKMVQMHAMPVARDKVEIVPSRLGSDAGPLGAAALVLERLFPSIQLAHSGLLSRERVL